jgi:hypothetical protein
MNDEKEVNGIDGPDTSELKKAGPKPRSFCLNEEEREYLDHWYKIKKVTTDQEKIEVLRQFGLYRADHYEADVELKIMEYFWICNAVRGTPY